MNYSSSQSRISNMSTLILATFLVSLLFASGWVAIAYLFPQHNSPD